ncbi:unnamed protein product [Rotaria sordida]|uniref:Uncharacterized protein n=2 Tax=Rotaria sordida TaxID=392033 RepID=A0A814TUE3_9BILA|nr:unnamed protein product [Rotaria sordida]CAF1167130.1 unnamed protein product [Rotaria sordida]CAF1439562.1 unnamed protein product [Rotaria sordida]CAF1443673.1 unnamed protein product [Rotaria sordida]
MKPRYNLRIQPTKILISTTNKTIPSISSSRIIKKPKLHKTIGLKKKQNRRHSLRLTSNTKPIKSRSIIHETPLKLPTIENDNIEENSLNNDENDNYDELLARHHRHMLEEQKDRKLYERYVRGQRTLRRLQCRRTHTAHLNEATRSRLLRELERERRYTVQEQICTYLADHSIIFQHGCHLNSNEPINWTTLENEIPRQKHFDTVHQLDVMINNLKKVIRTSKSSISKPRLSVHERQKQRLVAAATTTPVILNNFNEIQSNEINSTISSMNTISQPTTISRLPCVRFVDDLLRTTNSQHLTCIQNVLLQKNNNNNQSRIGTNEISTPIAIRKQFLRPKSTHMNLSDSSQIKKRPLEKENCSLVTSTTNNHLHSNVVIRATSPMVSIKPSTSYRSYPNTRKHPIITNRRQTRLSMNV